MKINKDNLSDSSDEIVYADECSIPYESWIKLGKALLEESQNYSYDDFEEEIQFETKKNLNIITSIKMIEDFLKKKFLKYDIIYTNNQKIEFDIKESTYLYFSCKVVLLIDNEVEVEVEVEVDENIDSCHKYKIKYIRIEYDSDIDIQIFNKNEFESFLRSL
jgi:hypothetical protein